MTSTHWYIERLVWEIMKKINRVFFSFFPVYFPGTGHSLLKTRKHACKSTLDACHGDSGYSFRIYDILQDIHWLCNQCDKIHYTCIGGTPHASLNAVEGWSNSIEQVILRNRIGHGILYTLRVATDFSAPHHCIYLQSIFSFLRSTC